MTRAQPSPSWISLAFPSTPKKYASRPVPCFPEVNSSWPGFYLAPLPLLGLRHDISEERKAILSKGTALTFHFVDEETFKTVKQEGLTLETFQKRVLHPDSLNLSQNVRNEIESSVVTEGSLVSAQVYDHEVEGHALLSMAPRSKWLSTLVRGMWGTIALIAEGETDMFRECDIPVHVPLLINDHGPSTVGNDAQSETCIEDEWATIVKLHQSLSSIHEAFSVLISIERLRERKDVSPDELDKLESSYKHVYSINDSSFIEIYDALKGLYSLGGRALAENVAYTALSAPFPGSSTDWLEELSTVAESLLNDDLVSRSFAQPKVSAHILIDYVRHQHEKTLLSLTAKYGAIDQDLHWDAWLEHIRGIDRILGDYPSGHANPEDDGELAGIGDSYPTLRQRFSYTTPYAWTCTYSDEAISLTYEGSEKNQDSQYLHMWTESMRQQITRGVGLQCPFWDGSTCCANRFQSEVFRSGLENIWKHTELREDFADHPECHWAQQGCLKS